MDIENKKNSATGLIKLSLFSSIKVSCKSLLKYFVCITRIVTLEVAIIVICQHLAVEVDISSKADLQNNLYYFCHELCQLKSIVDVLSHLPSLIMQTHHSLWDDTWPSRLNQENHPSGIQTVIEPFLMQRSSRKNSHFRQISRRLEKKKPRWLPIPWMIYDINYHDVSRTGKQDNQKFMKGQKHLLNLSVSLLAGEETWWASSILWLVWFICSRGRKKECPAKSIYRHWLRRNPKYQLHYILIRRAIDLWNHLRWRTMPFHVMTIHSSL